MPLKSWAFKLQGHPVRAEVWWRFSGWSRQRLYVDHTLVAKRWGWFRIGRPLRASIAIQAGVTDQIAVRIRRGIRGLGCHVRLNDRPVQLDPQSVRIEKKKAHSAKNDGDMGVVYDNPLGCVLLFFPLLILILSLLIPSAAVIWWKKRRFVLAIRRQGRFLPWLEIEKRMCASPSTLIIQTGQKAGMRVWWTQDDVVTRSPLPQPAIRELFDPPGMEHPFAEWCHYYYLSEETGKALLTDPPKESRSRVSDLLHDLLREQPVRWTKELPLVRFVVTGFVQGDRLKSAARFAALLGSNPHESHQSLVAAVSDQEAGMRALARETLRLLKLPALDAGPALVDQLYFGPWTERYSVAETLAMMEPPNIETLEMATRCDDPWIKCPAKCAVSEYDKAVRHAGPNHGGLLWPGHPCSFVGSFQAEEFVSERLRQFNDLRAKKEQHVALAEYEEAASVQQQLEQVEKELRQYCLSRMNACS